MLLQMFSYCGLTTEEITAELEAIDVECADVVIPLDVDDLP